ncbi:kelch-like protein diablo [Hydra vulgaris]|uniref:kelch-like protein diablo n=1 Tax=Hydra vulgaris TaxID=6087 RepID=UPI0002B4875D|nr:kelch-like protein diablo [Hydra vulgaris]
MFVEVAGGDRVCLREPSYSKNVMSSMAQFRKDGTLCDVTLNVDGKKFFVHKNVLASCSEYFKVMFASSLIEGTKSEICINTVTSEVFEELLDYFYEGTLKMDMHSIVDLLHAASLFLLNDVISECFRHLNRQMNATNCLRIKGIAEAYSNKQLISKCKEFTKKNFELIIKEREILKTSLQELKSLLLSDDIVCQSEDSVALIVEKWLRERIHELEESQIRILFKTIRFPFLSENGRIKLMKFMEELDVMYPDAGYASILSFEQRHQARHFRRCSLTCRASQRVETVIFCVNKRGETFCYNILNHKFCRLERFPEYRLPGYLNVNNNVLYVTGGSNGLTTVFSRDVYSYDVTEIKWNKLMPMVNARDQHCATFFQDNLYVIGGRNLQNFVENLSKKVECYDVAKNVWSTVADTLHGRVNSCATSSHKYMYVIGGNQNVDGIDASETVEKYCIRKHSWELLPNMCQKRISCSSVFYNDKLYVFGGSNGFFDLPNFEFYEEKSNKWTLVSVGVPGPINVALAMDNEILTMGVSAWNDDSVYRYSAVAKRNCDVWTEIKEFIHPSHRVKHFKYAVLRISNYYFNKKLDGLCDCCAYDPESSFDEDELLTSSNEDSDGDEWALHWGLWI